MWMLCGQGRDSGQFASLSRRVASPRGTLNAVLSDVGDAFVLPLYADDERAAPLRETQSIVSMYGSQYRCVPTEQLDAIFFVREVSPLRV